MISIKFNRQFKQVFDIYGDANDLKSRYDWFLHEAGKRLTKIFQKNLNQRLKTLPGGLDYKKRLVVAEIRDKGKRSWFAILARGKPVGSVASYDPNTSVFHVVSRYQIEGDPVFEVLEALGPWTVDTIPFVPSARQGQVVMKTLPEKQAKAIREKNFNRGSLTTSRMLKFGLPFEDRDAVHKKLKVIRDLEVEAIRMEFGLTKGKAHWRPSLRWLKQNAVVKLQRETDLWKIWVDPKFKKYRFRRPLKVKFSPADLKRIQKFQEKVQI